jgi:hypothetical protein
VLQFGDNGGAIGTLVGEENRGLEYMFIMMNAARFGVGMQGIGLAERAYQQAVAFAKDRVQSRDLAGSAGPVAIINHPDVRRMLMSMRAQTEAARALAYVGAGISDVAHYHADEATRKANLAVYEYLVPVIKGWSTEMSENVARDGVQVHGGMGFIEETGAAQHYRDARIAPIYEGTNGIQAMDLVGRKLSQDGGQAARDLIADMKATLAQLPKLYSGKPVERFAAAVEAVEDATLWLIDAKADAARGADVLAAADAYLRLVGDVAGGWMLAKGALHARDQLDGGQGDPTWLEGRITLYEVYAANVLGHVTSRLAAVGQGGALLERMSVDVLAG